ncbi:MAG: hypothetical protein ACKPKS_19740, partial [Dolichospermum sp.]
MFPYRAIVALYTWLKSIFFDCSVYRFRPCFVHGIALKSFAVMVLVKTNIFSNAIAIIFQMRILLDEQRPRALN